MITGIIILLKGGSIYTKPKSHSPSAQSLVLYIQAVKNFPDSSGDSGIHTCALTSLVRFLAPTKKVLPFPRAAVSAVSAPASLCTLDGAYEENTPPLQYDFR